MAKSKEKSESNFKSAPEPASEQTPKPPRKIKKLVPKETEPIKPKNIVKMKLGDDHLPHKPSIALLKRGPVTELKGAPKIEHPVFRITNANKTASKTFEVCYIPEIDTSFTVELEAGQSVKIGISIKPEPDMPKLTDHLK